MEVMPWFCLPCDEYVSGNLEDHFRIIHPDLGVELETWPDGAPVIVDETVEEEFFK
jgi:hypothetical protein